MDKSTENKVKNSIKDFELNERYDNFSSSAEELIKNCQIYNETYNKILSNSFEELVTAQQIKHAIFGANLTEKSMEKYL